MIITNCFFLRISSLRCEIKNRHNNLFRMTNNEYSLERILVYSILFVARIRIFTNNCYLFRIICYASNFELNDTKVTKFKLHNFNIRQSIFGKRIRKSESRLAKFTSNPVYSVSNKNLIIFSVKN